tara:strand:- start:1523 stop:1795 length:273 start_codon:yes stop_codon:yes gene_type:complete
MIRMIKVALVLLCLVGCSSRKDNHVFDDGTMTISKKAAVKQGYRYTITDNKNKDCPGLNNSGWEIYTAVELSVGDRVTISKKEESNEDAD